MAADASEELAHVRTGEATQQGRASADSHLACAHLLQR